jgi:hypothetical protein
MGAAGWLTGRIEAGWLSVGIEVGWLSWWVSAGWPVGFVARRLVDGRVLWRDLWLCGGSEGWWCKETS